VYKAFFHLKRNPFDLHPDPYFMYATPCHHEAFASLYYGIRSHKGFMVLTGEVGTGKTLVLRCLTDQLDKLQVQFAYVFNPMLSPEELLKYTLADLGLRGQYPSKNELLFEFYGYLAQRQKLGQTTVLIVDEAHLLSRELLEEIRLLGNLENQQGKLLQVALVGQPELDERLDSVELRQLKQRIALRCQLQPLSQEQTREYVNWRLLRAGANGQAPIFGAEAIAEVYGYSGGYPRLINTICDNSLIFACGAATRVITAELVTDACKDLRIERRLEPGDKARLGAALAEAPRKMSLGGADEPEHKVLEGPLPNNAVLETAPKVAS
jgi:general secretion pathway protein A